MQSIRRCFISVDVEAHQHELYLQKAKEVSAVQESGWKFLFYFLFLWDYDQSVTLNVRKHFQLEINLLDTRSFTLQETSLK